MSESTKKRDAERDARAEAQPAQPEMPDELVLHTDPSAEPIPGITPAEHPTMKSGDTADQ